MKESDPSTQEKNQTSKSVIDTSKMSEGQRAALEITEAARNTNIKETSFVADLFMGRWRPDKMFPYQPEPPEQKAEADAFLEKLKTFLNEKVDADLIDRTGEVPQEVLDGLAELGAFGIKIPKEYGGLGLSQSAYCRASTLLGSHCANLFALLSVHQSVGVPQPLMLFGTEEQKKTFLPRVAGGEISAFALTEDKVGSDPARMETTADPSDDDDHFILNGEKLWCSNGLKAGVIIVTAKTPPVEIKGRKKEQITAFVLDMKTPGIEIICRCHFMGLRALYNGVVRFTNVRIPRENIVAGEGRGLKVALTTLNAGRLSIPASCVGLSKRCITISRSWSKNRIQWGSPIGEHSAIADKLRRIAANTFAMEAMISLTARQVDQDKNADIRLEAAICKMWGTEKAWESIDHTLQLCGGRGYETQKSLQDRGEIPLPIERMMRDARVNTIFEGSSEIMRLFIMREALDPHLKAGGAVVNSQLPMGERFKAALKAFGFYASWYPKQWLPSGGNLPPETHKKISRHMGYVAKQSRRMARRLFHKMALIGPSLEKRQVLLGRFADIGADLFVISASCAYASWLLKEQNSEEESILRILDDACLLAQERINQSFAGIRKNSDQHGYEVAQEVMDEKFTWMENGIS